MTPREHPCDCDLTDDHGEAAELRRRLEARGNADGDLISRAAAIAACRSIRLRPGASIDEATGAMDCASAIAALPATQAQSVDPKLDTPAMEAEPVDGAPERTFVTWPNIGGTGLAFNRPAKTRTEYVRADFAMPKLNEAEGGMPEHIWAGRSNGYGGWHECSDYVNRTEYIRADLAQPQDAESLRGEVERWTHLPHPNTHKMVTRPDGEWVDYEDFAAVRAERDAALARVADLERRVKVAQY